MNCRMENSRFKSNTINILSFVLFTILAMLIGVLTVYFTSSKSSMFELKVDFECLTHL